MSRRYDKHLRVSSECKEVLDEMKSEIYQNPDDKTYGELIAYLAGHYHS